VGCASLIGLLASCGAEASPEPEAKIPKLELEGLPSEYRELAAAVAEQPDPDARATAVRELSRVAGAAALDVFVTLLEDDPSSRVRERSARALRDIRDPRAVAALEEAVSSDPDPQVALEALDELQTRWTSRMLGLVEGRLSRETGESEAERKGREGFVRAQEHWLTLLRNGMLPRFMREAPAVFEAVGAKPRVRVVAFGDFGSGAPNQLQTAAAIGQVHARDPFDFGVTLGDNFYPRGVESPEDPFLERAWIKPYAELGVRFYAALGNHDWGLPGSPAAEIRFSDASANWSMPAARYSFTASDAQFFVLDTTALSVAQLEWLDRELRRSRARWRIVIGHHPIRSHGRYGDNETMVKRLLPLLKGRADLYLAGHEHDLQVLEPEDGVYFVISGAGGMSIRPTEPGPRTRFAASTFGFTVLEIEAEQLRVRMYDSKPQVLYEFAIEPRPRYAEN